MRETGRREDGDLLPTGNRVHDVDRRDTGLDHLFGVDSRVRVDRTAVDVEVLFGKHFRALVDRETGPVEDAAEHVLRDRELHARAGELDVSRVDVDAGGAFENLDDRLAARDFEDLTAANGAVREGQGDDL